MKLSRSAATIAASAVMLAGGGGVAYAATCPGMSGSTGTTGTTGTTTTTGTTSTTSAATNSVRLGSRRQAFRHSTRR